MLVKTSLCCLIDNYLLCGINVAFIIFNMKCLGLENSIKLINMLLW
jgi:hypothetical protein